jgi:hypothetical protein
VSEVTRLSTVAAQERASASTKASTPRGVPAATSPSGRWAMPSKSTIVLHRETEDKAHQPETKLDAIVHLAMIASHKVTEVASRQVKFPSSTQRLCPLQGALRAPPGLRLLPGMPRSGARIVRCPPPCPSRPCQSLDVLFFAGATRPYVDRARTPRRELLDGSQCAVLPSPRLRWFRPVFAPHVWALVFGGLRLSAVACWTVALAVCEGVSGASLVWVCLVWLGFVCVWPRLFAFRRPCCSVCPLSIPVTDVVARYLV